MSDNIVREGDIGSLAALLTRKLARRVVVHRDERQFRLPGGKMKKEIRYTLAIQGCHPSAFFGLTVNEVKSRMAMLSDMLSSGVINANPIDTETDPRADRKPPVPEDAPGRSAPGFAGQEQGDAGGYSGLGVPPSGDDRY